MASAAEKRSLSLRTTLNVFVIIWLIVAAFPFLWTLWGSFKVELDFFSIANWMNALTGERTKEVYGTAFISGELEFIRKPSHGQKIIVVPMYILAIAASATYMIPIHSGERISFITTVHLSIIFLLTLIDQVTH